MDIQAAALNIGYLFANRSQNIAFSLKLLKQYHSLLLEGKLTMDAQFRVLKGVFLTVTVFCRTHTIIWYNIVIGLTLKLWYQSYYNYE